MTNELNWQAATVKGGKAGKESSLERLGDGLLSRSGREGGVLQSPALEEPIASPLTLEKDVRLCLRGD